MQNYCSSFDTLEHIFYISCCSFISLRIFWSLFLWHKWRVPVLAYTWSLCKSKLKNFYSISDFSANKVIFYLFSSLTGLGVFSCSFHLYKHFLIDFHFDFLYENATSYKRFRWWNEKHIKWS